MQAEFSQSTGPTSETTGESKTCQQSTVFGSSLEASPVSRPASQESDSARQTTAGSGRRLLPLLKGLGPRGFCLKTLLESCLSTTEWNSSVSVLRWKAKGTKFNRLLFQLAVSGLSIEETESGLWPTPSANNYEQADTEKLLERRERLKAEKNNGNGFGLTLGNAARMFPAPQAFDAKDLPDGNRAERRSKGGCRNLAQEARMWPTPKANAHQNPGEHGAGGKDLTTEVCLKEMGMIPTTGQLNPEWVAWLMGYPTEWVNLEHSETPSSPKSHSSSSSE